MKLSKFFQRVFVATMLLYLFFLVTSFFVGYYVDPNYTYYNLGIAFTMVFFYIMHIGFQRREGRTEIRQLAKKFQENSRYIR